MILILIRYGGIGVRSVSTDHPSQRAVVLASLGYNPCVQRFRQRIAWDMFHLLPIAVLVVAMDVHLVRLGTVPHVAGTSWLPRRSCSSRQWRGVRTQPSVHHLHRLLIPSPPPLACCTHSQASGVEVDRSNERLRQVLEVHSVSISIRCGKVLAYVASQRSIRSREWLLWHRQDTRVVCGDFDNASHGKCSICCQ